MPRKPLASAIKLYKPHLTSAPMQVRLSDGGLRAPASPREVGGVERYVQSGQHAADCERHAQAVEALYPEFDLGPLSIAAHQEQLEQRCRQVEAEQAELRRRAEEEGARWAAWEEAVDAIDADGDNLCDECHIPLDENDGCPQCGVYHGDPCPSCGRRGYHSNECDEAETCTRCGRRGFPDLGWAPGPVCPGCQDEEGK